MKATGADLLPINDRILWGQDSSQSAPGMFHDLHLRAERGFDPLDEAAFLVGAIRPDELESRQAVCEGFQQQFAALMILDIGLMHQHLQEQPIGVDKQVALASFDLFPIIVAARPPFTSFLFYHFSHSLKYL